MEDFYWQKMKNRKRKEKKEKKLNISSSKRMRSFIIGTIVGNIMDFEPIIWKIWLLKCINESVNYIFAGKKRINRVNMGKAEMADKKYFVKWYNRWIGNRNRRVQIQEACKLTRPKLKIQIDIQISKWICVETKTKYS